jgi:hypothetical protein
LGGIRKKILKYTDERIKLTNEILSGIKIIKYFTWENSFLKKISIIRKNEMKQFMIYSIFQSIINSLITGNII